MVVRLYKLSKIIFRKLVQCDFLLWNKMSQYFNICFVFILVFGQ